MRRARPPSPRARRSDPPGSVGSPRRTAQPCREPAAPRTRPRPPLSSSDPSDTRSGNHSPRRQLARSARARPRLAPRLRAPLPRSAALPGAPGSTDPAPSPADHPSRPEGARVSSPARLLSSSGCSLLGPGAKPEARFLIAQAGCIPTPISSNATPSPGTYFRMASDMAFVLDDGENLRVLPILGKGAGQNAYDIRFLKGVDLGFVRTDTLQQLREDNRVSNVERHITYVARLFNDELHIIAPREITNIRDLAGKKVSFDVKGSGTDYTGRSMFKGLGLRGDQDDCRPGAGRYR